MGYVIALAGKGGTGKTTIAALLVRLLRENKKSSILAIDADPNSNLNEALGVEIKDTVGEILDKVSAHPESVTAGMSKEKFIEYQLRTALAEGNGFDLLAMGKPEGPGCYCYVNNVLRNIVNKLLTEYNYIIIDNEAGLEHLSRRTTRSCDSLLIVSDDTVVGLKSAERILALADNLKIKIGKRYLLLNRIRNQLKEFPEINGVNFCGVIPWDEEIIKLSSEGSSVESLNMNSISIEALRKMGDKIWQ